TMYEQMGRNVSGNLFDSQTTSQEPAEENISEEEVQHTDTEEPETGFSGETEEVRKAENAAPAAESEQSIPEETIQKVVTAGAKKRIVQVMVIYEDDTFRAFTPAK
ncbi:MAG: hypothetical protein U9R49_15530, partial [Bacteroidota bacterium]|nr:hypothetical protein [Bacteroidota bacterium]